MRQLIFPLFALVIVIAGCTSTTPTGTSETKEVMTPQLTQQDLSGIDADLNNLGNATDDLDTQDIDVGVENP